MSTTTETPFTINIPDDHLAALKQKLELTTFPDELEGAGWDYGVPLADVKRLVAYWKDGFDWRKQEQKLNELPHFTRDVLVDGYGSLNIHYVHQKSEVKDAIPLLFVHGWPGNFLEVIKILPLLLNGASDGPSFHVVAYSLPNYGFSEGPKTKGFASAQYAEVGHKLMLSLGYDEYVVQGGDWGRLITHNIAYLYGPKHCKAWHTNMPAGTKPTFGANPLTYIQHLLTPYTPAEKRGLQISSEFEIHGRGYNLQQSTRPQTLGYALSDSPSALLSWILDKLVTWSDEYPWTDDEILAWMNIYWFSRAGPAANVRIYYEVTNDDKSGIRTKRPIVPLGVSYFPQELHSHPTSWMKMVGNLVITSRHDSGGHFAAYEKPEELVSDVRAMFAKGGPCYGVVSGKSGYT